MMFQNDFSNSILKYKKKTNKEIMVGYPKINNSIGNQVNLLSI